MLVRKPAHLFLDELQIPYDDQDSYICRIKQSTLFTSTILSRVLTRPNVKLFNVVTAEDLIVKEGRVVGVVTNWALASMNHATQSCMDPNVMDGKIKTRGMATFGRFGLRNCKVTVLRNQAAAFAKWNHQIVAAV
ncbi:hypothetical protein J5N97_017230 [Dioscorea zingiberensis]|uniref:Uncharacterized protein n=1 Tax=Dioscorea zingiberensis TaxID=325984 RepID=A0A9D5CNH2_9LILI|nr:hypothetical protein J5N97_017230 [Dioscorea zingiberensis]